MPLLRCSAAQDHRPFAAANTLSAPHLHLASDSKHLLMGPAGRVLSGCQGQGAHRACDAAGHGPPDAQRTGGQDVQRPRQDGRPPSHCARRPRQDHAGRAAADCILASCLGRCLNMGGAARSCPAIEMMCALSRSFPALWGLFHVYWMTLCCQTLDLSDVLGFLLELQQPTLNPNCSSPPWRGSYRRCSLLVTEYLM